MNRFESEDIRVVITGAGGVSPVGNDLPSSWLGVITEKHGITTLENTNAANYESSVDLNSLPVKVAAGADIAENPILQSMKRDARYMHRSAMMGSIAAYQALDQARLIEQGFDDPFRVGFFVGSTFSGADYMSYFNPDRVVPTDAFKYLPARVATAAAMATGLQGRGSMIGAECASGALAIDLGIDSLLPHRFRNEIRPPRADIMVVGGSDAPLSPMNIKLFTESLKGAADPREDPEIVSRPFDADAEGLVVGEAAAVLVLERWSHAQARGIREEDVLAEVAGFASYTHPETRTLAGHEGTVRAITDAMTLAGIAVGETVYINAHATSTVEGDPREARAITDAVEQLGLDPNDVYTSSTKGATGHTMGAAGALEAYFASMAVKQDVLPPNLKFESPAPGAEGLNIVTNTRVKKVDAAVSNSLGFGGPVTSLAFRKFKA